MDRVVVLVDMDCFYVQVEERLQPEYRGKPCAVVQYNPWQGGAILAVNYEARSYGVTRGMRGNEAKKKCPDLHLFYVPEVRGKADLTRYREAGAEVLEVLSQFCDCVERASIDEAYLDMTAIAESKLETDVTFDKLPHTFVVGWEEQEEGEPISQWLRAIKENGNIPDKKLAVVAMIVEEMREAVFASTKFRCSAGIAHNKMLAKLACGLHKPNRQAVIPHASVPELYRSTPIQKLRNLGGKLGEEVKEKLGIETMAELAKFSERKLRQEFGDKNGPWLFNVARGIENETVTARQLPKSIGCGKNFLGKLALNSKEKVRHWLLKLAEELEERLTRDQRDNNRFAKALTVHLRYHNDSGYGSASRGCRITSYISSKIAQDAYKAIEKFNTAQSSSPLWTPRILNLSLTAGRFHDYIDIGSSKIENYFGGNTKSPKKKVEEAQKQDCNTSKQSLDADKKDSFPTSSVISPFNLGSSSKVQMENSDKRTDFFGESSNTTYNGQSPFEAKTDSATSSGNKPQIGPKKGFFAAKLQKLNSINNEIAMKNCDTISIQNSDNFVIQSNDLSEENKHNLINSTETSNVKELFDFNFASNTVSTVKSNINSDSSVMKDDKTVEKIPEELEVKCKTCNQHIPVWELQEHEDYHFAVRLQNGHKEHTQEDNNRPNQAAQKKTNATKKRNSTKNSGATKKLKGNTKTIEFFFKK